MGFGADMADLSADIIEQFGEPGVLANRALETRANPDTGALNALEELLITEGGLTLSDEAGNSFVLEGAVADPTVSYDVFVYPEMKKRRQEPGQADVRYLRCYVSGLNLPELTTSFVLTLGDRSYTILAADFVKAEGEVAIYILEAEI